MGKVFVLYGVGVLSVLIVAIFIMVLHKHLAQVPAPEVTCKMECVISAEGNQVCQAVQKP